MSMNIYTPSNEKVRFVEQDVSEDQINWGTHTNPNGYLEYNNIYTIEKTEIHSYHTKVFLKEFPGKSFNSVWFENV